MPRTKRKMVMPVKGASDMVERFRRDARALIARSRKEVLKDVRVVRERADRAVRDLERRVVKQFHAATDEQVARLERRVAKLERMMEGMSGRASASDKAA